MWCAAVSCWWRYRPAQPAKRHQHYAHCCCTNNIVWAAKTHSYIHTYIHAEGINSSALQYAVALLLLLLLYYYFCSGIEMLVGKTWHESLTKCVYFIYLL